MTMMENKARFFQIFHEKIQREGADKLLDFLEKSDFFTAPASTKYHGAHEGGLLEHSLTIATLMRSAAEPCIGVFIASRSAA